MVDRRREALEEDVREIEGSLKIMEGERGAYDRQFEAIGKGALA